MLELLAMIACYEFHKEPPPEAKRTHAFACKGTPRLAGQSKSGQLPSPDRTLETDCTQAEFHTSIWGPKKLDLKSLQPETSDQQRDDAMWVVAEDVIPLPWNGTRHQNGLGLTQFYCPSKV